MSPTLLAALINQFAVPEILRWLAQLHSEGRVVSEEEALAKLQMDADVGNAAGAAFLRSHGGA